MENSCNIKGDISILANGYLIEGFAEENQLFYRTFGLKEIFNLELEINLSLDPSEVKRILDYICNSNIINWDTCQDGLITSDLTGAPVLIQKRKAKYPKYKDEECYRIIFSDENFLLPTDKNCNDIYKHQLD